MNLFWNNFLKFLNIYIKLVYLNFKKKKKEIRNEGRKGGREKELFVKEKM